VVSVGFYVTGLLTSALPVDIEANNGYHATWWRAVAMAGGPGSRLSGSMTWKPAQTGSILYMPVPCRPPTALPTDSCTPTRQNGINYYRLKMVDIDGH